MHKIYDVGPNKIIKNKPKLIAELKSGPTSNLFKIGIGPE